MPKAYVNSKKNNAPTEAPYLKRRKRRGKNWAGRPKEKPIQAYLRRAGIAGH